MTEKLREFIENNIQLIQDLEFEQLYRKIYSAPNELTEVLLAVGVDPLDYMTQIPEYYMATMNINRFVVPEHIVSIESGAFADCSNLVSVVLPEGLERIGEDAFADSGLEQVTLPQSLKSIQREAFAGTRLKSIVIPDNVQTIHLRSFEECEDLETVVLGKSVRILGHGAFGNCYGLSSVQLNEGLEIIRDYAFKNCTSLKDLYIPESVKKIEPGAFYGTKTKILCKKSSYAHRFAKNIGQPLELVD